MILVSLSLLLLGVSENSALIYFLSLDSFPARRLKITRFKIKLVNLAILSCLSVLSYSAGDRRLNSLSAELIRTANLSCLELDITDWPLSVLIYFED